MGLGHVYYWMPVNFRSFYLFIKGREGGGRRGGGELYITIRRMTTSISSKSLRNCKINRKNYPRNSRFYISIFPPFVAWQINHFIDAHWSEEYSQKKSDLYLKKQSRNSRFLNYWIQKAKIVMFKMDILTFRY